MPEAHMKRLYLRIDTACCLSQNNS